MEQLFRKCRKTAEEIYRNFDASHDLDHIDRVMKNALEIVVTEPSANKTIIKLGVLLHDIEDPKYNVEGNFSIQEILEMHGADEKLIDEVVACIDSVSFSGGNEKSITSIEGAIIRDADRLMQSALLGLPEHSLLVEQEEENYTMQMKKYEQKCRLKITVKRGLLR